MKFILPICGPITVMGDHMHKKMNLCFLLFSKMLMDGMLNGTKKITVNSVMSAPNGASDSSGRYELTTNNENEYVYVWWNVCTY